MIIYQTQFILLLSICTFLTAACDHKTEINKGDIFVSEILSIYKVNPKSGEKEKVLNDRVYDIAFNKALKKLFITNVDEEGFTELSTANTSHFHTGLIAPHHIYSYKQFVIMDSFEIIKDNKGKTMSQFGIYDMRKKKLVKVFKVYGSFAGIKGYKNFAYVSTYDVNKQKSNVYEVNLYTITMRPVFQLPQARAPIITHNSKGDSYGLYTHWDFKPRNELVKLDVKTGSKKTITKLDSHCHNLTIVGNLAVIVHFNELNSQENIPKPITIVNLTTGKATQMNLGHIRPTNVITYQEKFIAVTSENGFLFIIDPFQKKVVTKHFVTEGLYFLAEAT